MKKEPVTPNSLDDIRTAIREIDLKRRDETLTAKQREILELSAVVLRDAERVAIIALQKEVIDGLASSVEDLKKRSRSIRARVTRMNKVPKVLDNIEQAMGYAITAMKAISRWAILLVFTIFCATSCAVLTTSQVKMAESLAIASDTLTTAPSTLFDNLTEARANRGLLYAASLSSPEAHCKEVIAISGQLQKEAKQADKASAYIKALNSYCSSIKSLANANRWKQYGTELKGIGRRSDSILIYLNNTDLLDDEILTGMGKLTGRYTAILTENYMKCRQAKALKEYVTEADTLVQACADSLVKVLKSQTLKHLIEYEETALKDDYRAFVDAASRTSQYMAIITEADRTFIETDALLASTTALNSKCITALNTFAKAHKKLAANLEKRSDTSRSELAEDIYDDIIELNELSASMVRLLSK